MEGGSSRRVGAGMGDRSEAGLKDAALRGLLGAEMTPRADICVPPPCPLLQPQGS